MNASEMNDHDRIVRLETQMERYNSDYESEKRGRAEHRAYVETKLERIDIRFQRIEATMYKVMGGFSVIVVLADLLVKVLFGK